MPELVHAHGLHVALAALPLGAGALGAQGLPAIRGDRAQRRAQGAFYTPPELCELVLRLALGPWLEAGAPRVLTILDPAAGDGRFLRGAAALLAQHGWPRPRLWAIERDEQAAAALRQGGDVAQVWHADALLGWQGEPVDCVVGNPPYLRSVNVRKTDHLWWARLRGAFLATSWREWDVYGAFLEKSLAWLLPGGRAAWLVPSRWLRAAYAAKLRALLAPHVDVLLDFGATQLFPDATTYLSTVSLCATPLARPIVSGRRVNGAWALTQVAREAPDPEAPWRGHQTAQWPIGRVLGELVAFAKGTGTNANGVFIVAPGIARGALVPVTTEADEQLDLEAEALRPVWRGRDVPRLAEGGRPVAMCIFPYVGKRLVPWPEVCARWPRVAAYLARHEPALRSRERGRFDDACWYRFGRPQNHALLCEPRPKVVFPDITAGARCVVDGEGTLVLDSAYAARPTAAWREWFDGDEAWATHALAVLLASPVTGRWLVDAGVPLRGNYQRMKPTPLAAMPVPEAPAAWRAIGTAAARGAWEDATQQLAQLYAVT